MPRSSVRILAIAACAATLTACHRTPARRLPEPPHVRVVRVERRDLTRTMELPGSVRGYFEATLYAQVPGYVTAVHFDKGDLVKKGDVIAEIEVPELTAHRSLRAAEVHEAHVSVARAEALLETARSQEQQARADLARARVLADLEVKLHERAKKLRSDNDISEQDLEVAQGRHEAAAADVALAEAKLATAAAEVERAHVDVEVARTHVEAAGASLREVEAELSFATIVAPYDGVVTARFLDPGALVQRATRTDQAQAVVSLSTRGRVRVDFETPEGEVAFVRSGTRVELTTSAYPGRRLPCRVARVASMLWPTTRTMLSEAEYENEENLLLPGMYATVKLFLEEHRSSVVVPPEALIEGREGRGGGRSRSAEASHAAKVFVVEGGRARERRIEKGWEFGDHVEVTKGLEGHETVILSAGDLGDGDEVTGHPVAGSPSREKTDAAGKGDREAGLP